MVSALAGSPFTYIGVPYMLYTPSTCRKSRRQGKRANAHQVRVLDNSLLGKRIEDMVRQQVTAKGLRQVDVDEHPDLLVHFWVGVKEKEVVESTGPMVGPYGGRGYGGVTTYQYKEGTLIIDLMTPPKNDLVWRGNIVGILSKAKEENMQMVNQGISKAFEDYPPKGKTQ